MKLNDSAVRSLFGMSPAEFHERFPSSPVVAHDRCKDAAELFAIPELQDVHALLAAWKGNVGVHPRGLSDDSRVVLVPPRVAKEFLRMGCNLSFNFMDGVLPGLRAWLTRLAAELGFPASTAMKCLGFFSSKGSGTVPHFDNRTNISVQVHGRKQWRLAPNTHVADPDFRYVMYEGRDIRMGDRPELQMTGPLPTQMPEEGLQVETFVRGSVAYIPRGHWHATYAMEDSLAFNFWFETRDWRHLVVQAIADRLVQHPRWRALARGAGSDGELGTRARASLEALLDGVHRDIGELSVEDVLASVRKVTPAVPTASEWYEEIFLRGWVQYSASER